MNGQLSTFTEVKSYRDILRNELEKRCNCNPHYSLRAFSRDLGLNPSRFSRILNNKEGLSKKYAQIIAKNLSYNETESEYFCNLVIASDARSKVDRKVAETKLLYSTAKQNKSATLELETFKVISNWYHIAILELVEIDGFKNCPKYISSKLEISEFEAKSAIDSPLKLNLLELDELGDLKRTATNLFTPDGTPSESIRAFHKDIINKACIALQTQTIDERYYSNTMFAVSKPQLSEISKMIKNLQASVIEYLNRTNDEPKDELYNLSVQLFKLSARRSKNEKLN